MVLTGGDDFGHTVTTSSCPKCRKELDRASAHTDHSVAPKPGDFSVCMYCATPLIFGRDMALRRLTRREESALDPNERRELARVQSAISKFWNMS